MTFQTHDRNMLRNLAKHVADIAHDPVMATRRKMWVEHNSLRSTSPMMLVFPEGGWEELLPESVLLCETQPARAIELELRKRMYHNEHFQDDTVVDNEWIVSKVINPPSLPVLANPITHDSGWGVLPQLMPSKENRGAWGFVPVIKGPSDLKKLTYPEIMYDETTSLQNFNAFQELFGDILTVKLTGVKRISYHLMQQYVRLRGLEEVLYDMYDRPQMIHDAMAILEEGHRQILNQYVAQNLLTINNDNTYHSSGGNSFTDELPLPDAEPDYVRPCDMWASAESQEMAAVGPRQHVEFAMEYEKRLLEPFGLTGYGCCEDLTKKLDRVLAIPHIRRISISPWANVDVCAEKLRGRYIFSWKPNPAHLVGEFRPKAIREYIRHTVEVTQANDCVLEIILKDTHTCEYHPERFDEWTSIAREVIIEDLGS